MPTIDLNCDVGEGVGPDELLLAHVTSANIACGLHAGDPETMRRTVALALANGVALGAHPSFDDREGFGRRNVNLPPNDLRTLVVRQVVALATIAAEQGARLSHVKPHGALYNMAATRPEMAGAIAAAVRSVDPTLILFGLARSALISAGRYAGLATAEEAFVDRRYAADGMLVSRTVPGAVIEDEREAIDQALRIVQTRMVRSIDGDDVHVRADTICIHGDTPGAADVALRVRFALEKTGVTVRAPVHRLD